MVSEVFQEKREKDGIRGVAGKTGEGWCQSCCRKTRRRMVSEVLQEEQEKDGIRGVAGRTREGWYERCCKEERTGRVRMEGWEKVGAGKDGL